jgi:hypothetical protein
VRRVIALLLPTALAAAGCGGTTVDRDVVKAWADAVRAGRFEAADALFALPAKVANGGRPLRFRHRYEVDFFNRSLPCGAILRSTRKTQDGRLVATFELTERQGPGANCGAGTGHPAAVRFLVRDGRIVEWLRVESGRSGGQLT